MIDELNQNITRAKELLSTVRHASMATVNEDESPLNTPYLFMINQALTKLYWGSHPDSLHSKNVMRTGQLFVVLYDAQKPGGLYIRADNGHIAKGVELDEALAIHNAVRKKEDKEPLEKSYYIGESPQRMWCADINHFWIIASEKDANGLLIKESREEITAKDLLG